jgi:DNA-binding transcriptional MerR regulator
MDTWTVGELAVQTGLTVRTLHHYDDIGLARSSRRSSAGHRRYTAGDVRRLHRTTHRGDDRRTPRSSSSWPAIPH